MPVIVVENLLDLKAGIGRLVEIMQSLAAPLIDLLLRTGKVLRNTHHIAVHPVRTEAVIRKLRKTRVRIDHIFQNDICGCHRLIEYGNDPFLQVPVLRPVGYRAGHLPSLSLYLLNGPRPRVYQYQPLIETLMPALPHPVAEPACIGIPHNIRTRRIYIQPAGIDLLPFARPVKL